MLTRAKQDGNTRQCSVMPAGPSEQAANGLPAASTAQLQAAATPAALRISFASEGVGEPSTATETEPTGDLAVWPRLGAAQEEPARTPSTAGFGWHAGVCSSPVLAPCEQFGLQQPVTQADVLMETSRASSPNTSACVIDLILQDRYLARGHMYLCVGRANEGMCQRAAWIV